MCTHHHLEWTCAESQRVSGLFSVNDRGHCACFTYHTTVLTASLPFFHIDIFLRQMNLPVSLPSASKCTIAIVLLRITSGRWTGTKGVPTFSVLSNKEIDQTHPEALLQDGAWGLFIQLTEQKVERRQEPLRSQTWPGYVRIEKKKEKWLTGCPIPILPVKEEKKYLTTLFSLGLRIPKNRNQNESQCPIWYRPEKLFQNGHNEWRERPGAPGQGRQNPEVRLGSLNPGAWAWPCSFSLTGPPTAN